MLSLIRYIDNIIIYYVYILSLSLSLSLSISLSLSLCLSLSVGIRGINGRGWQLPPTIPLEQFTRNPYAYTVTHTDRVCIHITNYDHDVHPIHLHGHTFQVRGVNGVAIYGAMRDTIQVPACGDVTICFDANAQPDSVHSLHCHMAVHEMSGMQTTIEYENYVPIHIPSTMTLDAIAYAASLQQPNSNTGTGGGSNIINNYYTSNNNNDTSDLTKTGLGVGLALGLALLLSWIFFGCTMYRYQRTHAYPSTAARGSLSMAHPQHTKGAQFHGDNDAELSQSRA